MIFARVFGAGFLFLLVWTIGVHVAVFSAFPFWTLYATLGLAVLASLYGAISRVTRIDGGAVRLPEVRLLPVSLRKVGAMRLGTAVLLASVFLVTAGIQYKFSNFVPFWIACLALGVSALAMQGRLKALLPLRFEQDTAAEARGTNLVFLGMALAMVAFYLFTSIPDSDDSLFLNFSVGAKEERGAIFTTDTMLGLPGLAFFKSTYRLESYQLLAAIISDATGWSVLFSAHTVIPVLICVWAASILTLIHSEIFPKFFPVTLLIHLVLLLAFEGSLQSFGHHSIPRFFQGKGPFVTVMVPLIAVLTIIALRQGSWRALLMLAGAIVISVGFTANAVYAGPLCAALLGLTFLLLGDKARWRALRLLLIVIYPACLALYLLLFDPPTGSQATAPGTVGGTLWVAFGTPATMLLGLAALFLGVCLPLLRRELTACGVYTLGFLTIVLNPFLWSYYGEFVTGNINYRLFWAVPLPLIAAVFLGLIWTSRNLVARALMLSVLAVGIAGPGSVLRKVEYGLAAYKIPTARFALAQRLVSSLGPEALLLAPEEISAWVTVLERSPSVVEGRSIYLPQRQDFRFAAALRSRKELFTFWNAREPDTIANPEVLHLLRQVGVSAVLADERRLHHLLLMEPLAKEGFREIWTDGTYRLLVNGI